MDSDLLVAENENMTIPDIFESKGEAYFRNAETEAIFTLFLKDFSIVAVYFSLPLLSVCFFGCCTLTTGFSSTTAYCTADVSGWACLHIVKHNIAATDANIMNKPLFISGSF